jgi:Flp pilus assembly protein TadG
MRNAPCRFAATNLPSARLKRPGVAAAELAILLPFLSFLLVVAVDYCRIFYYTQTLHNCAYSGALYASGTAQTSSTVTSTAAATQAAVAEGTTMNPPLQPKNVAVSFNQQTTTVTVQYEYQMLTPFLGDGGKVTITRQVTMGLAPTGGN